MADLRKNVTLSACIGGRSIELELSPIEISEVAEVLSKQAENIRQELQFVDDAHELASKARALYDYAKAASICWRNVNL